LNISFDPARFIGIMLGVIIGATVHEFMHAYTAVRLGDNSPYREGRITLNPLAHFEPFGFVLFVLMALGVGFFAMARPVSINPAALRNGRRGMVMVAMAGPLSNLVLGILFALPFRFGLVQNMSEQVIAVLYYMMYVNFLLFAFNLIPLPPLDGSHVLSGGFSPRWALIVEPLRRYGYAPILVLIMLPFVVPQLNLLNRMITPVVTLLFGVFAGPQI